MNNIVKATFLLISIGAFAQKGPEDFPELEMANIPGAPNLSQPILVTSKSGNPLISEGHGLGAPAFYDWDGDGLKDLLIGEFGSGLEKSKYVGNFVRVYKNMGTELQPEFMDQWDYARPPFELPGNGTPYSVDQFCCMGFTPQFIDLDHDGYLDMITGSYYGEVYAFCGSDKGFRQGTSLHQEFPSTGGPRDTPKNKKERKENEWYWLYSSASFGDLTGDGLPDLVTGGTMAMQISKNIGTSTEPKFAQREYLLDVDGNPLKIYTYNEEELKYYESLAFLGHKPPIAGDDHLSPYVVDWDQDGILDILVTNSYLHKGLATVDFLKGVKIGQDIRFQKPIALFRSKNGGKAFPGSGPRVAVVDWNQDGLTDLLIGIAVLTTYDTFNDSLSWQWEANLGLRGAGKDPANVDNLSPESLELYKKQLKEQVPKEISVDEYVTLRHQGLVYVLLGSNSTGKKPINK